MEDSIKVEGMHEVEVGPLPGSYEPHCFSCEEDIEEEDSAVLMLHMDVAMCFACLQKIVDVVRKVEAK